MSNIKYRNTRFRIIVAFIASIYILLHGHDLTSIRHAFVSSSFYLALLISFPITLMLVFIIHRVTIRLDIDYDWRHNFVKRLTWQFVFAVFLPAVIDIAFISIYSAIVGDSFNWSEFILYDFPIIIAFILMINMYYGIRYLTLTEKSSLNELNTQEGPILTIKYDRVFAQLNVREDVVFLYKHSNLVKIVTRNREYAIRDSLSALEALYEGSAFCRINRSTIVNLRYVEGYGPSIKRSTIEVFLNAQINLADYDEDTLIITAKYLSSFKREFGR